jgi:hypothetical protein
MHQALPKADGCGSIQLAVSGASGLATGHRKTARTL